MKLRQFTKIKHALAKRIAAHFGKPVPADVEQFFAAAEANNFEEMDRLFTQLSKRKDASNDSDEPELFLMWRAIAETIGIANESRDWPAQKLLDYGERVRARGLTLLEAPGNDAVSSTALAAAGATAILFTTGRGTPLGFLYADRMNTLTHQEMKEGFADYLADLEKRLAHYEKFPGEPKQVKPGENYKRKANGELDVNNPTGVMAVNERLLRKLMEKNPDLAFAIEESYALKTTYPEAAPLGPVMQLRAGTGDESLSPARATETAAYWAEVSHELLNDPDAFDNRNTRITYAKMASAHANLLKERNFITAAEQTYRTSLKLFPELPESVYGLADLYATTGRKSDKAT